MLLIMSCSAGLPPVDAGMVTLTPFPGPGSQQTYSYAGCEGAGTYHCPNSLVFTCALDSIRTRHAACQTAADCVLVRVRNCFGHLESCPPAAVSDAGAFLEEAMLEVHGYCDSASCYGSPSCAFDFTHVDCLAGRCVARTADGGP
jgi:hypothetical protein